jgi:HAD superfamily hydrolase (TIGR01509 family)
VKLVVFDFDGTILDTEVPVYDAWQEIYREHGHTLALEKWAECIGTADVFDPCADLQALVARTLDASGLKARHRMRTDALIAAGSILPGVVDYIVEAQRLGLTLGVASSSSRRWVEGHLQRLGLREAFSIIRCADDVPRVKPDPALYLSVLEAAGARASDAVALEDSPNGVRAAKLAGLRCVAVPNALTAGLDLSGADVRLASMAEIPLSHLLSRLRSG